MHLGIVSKSSMKQKIILFDTTVIIDYLRNKENAAYRVAQVIDGKSIAAVSPITDYELWSGIRNKGESEQYQVLLSYFRRPPINTSIIRRAGELAQPFKKARDYSISVQDFIIGATAEYNSMDILTRNGKDFCKIALQKVKVITYTI